MICLICRQVEIVETLTSVSLQRGEMHLMINNVPARVCPSCGEAYVDEEVAVRLLQSAEEIDQAGMLDTHYEYKTV